MKRAKIRRRRRNNPPSLVVWLDYLLDKKGIDISKII
jgi:hypothetical protein